MAKSIGMLTIALVGGISLLVWVVMVLLKKVKFNGVFMSYVLITLMPLILLAIPIALVYSILQLMLGNYLLPISIWIMSLDIAIFVVFVLVKFNIVPGTSLSQKANENNKLKIVATGRRLLHLAIYASLLYLLLILPPIIKVIITFKEPLGHLLGHLQYLLGHPSELIITLINLIKEIVILPFLMLILFFLPGVAPAVLGGVIGYMIVSTLITVLIGLIFIMSMNGTIRLIYASERIRKKGVIYIFLMLMPILNVVCMLYLCHVAKCELKTADVLQGFDMVNPGSSDLNDNL